MTPEDTSPKGKIAKHFPKIEGYRIAGVLGQGGMGIVYHAVQTKLNRAVALKVLPAIVGTASPSAVSRFRREATAAARLHHTNIVPIYDFGESRDSYYYAMELISGQPLNVLVRRFGEQNIGAVGPSRLAHAVHSAMMDTPAGLPEAGMDSRPGDESSGNIGSSTAGRGRPYYQQVARWMADAADALHYAHGEGVIHRDIKPSNLILSIDGRIMIADFGLAKLVGEESVTLTGSLLGTLRYISPEQAMAKRVRVDHRTDIYSLGAAMYELLCFQPAFPGDDDKEILGAIISRDPVRPRKVEHHVPHELETICLKTLEKSPDARYSSARGLAEDLRRYIHDLPIVAKRPGVVRRLFKFVRRHRAPVIAVVALVILVASALILVRVRAELARERAERKAAEVLALCESGMFFASHEKWDEAEAEFKKALDLNPDHIKTILSYIWMKIEYFKLHPDRCTPEQLEELNGWCGHVLECNPHELNALNYRGVILKKLGRYSEAVATAKAVIELNAEYFPGYSNLGAYNALMGDLGGAEECLRSGVELVEQSDKGRSEDRAGAWRNLAAVEAYLRDPSASVHIDRAIDAKADYIANWPLRVRIRLERDGSGDRMDALDDAKYADRLANEKNPRVKRMLALAHLRNEEFDQAVKHAESAIALGDMHCINNLILALAKANGSDWSAAASHLAIAADTWPTALVEGNFLATYDGGVLWFESRVELEGLREEVETLIAARKIQP